MFQNVQYFFVEVAQLIVLPVDVILIQFVLKRLLFRLNCFLRVLI